MLCVYEYLVVALRKAKLMSNYLRSHGQLEKDLYMFSDWVGYD